MAPPPGQHPYPTRTDQMTYACYDQEQGKPCVSPPPARAGRTRARISVPGPFLLRSENAETEAIARWLDDGGIDPSEAGGDAKHPGSNEEQERVASPTPVLV